ncbi:MAG TPA: Asp-tRNA(Asn)/Glu-tRNA(Gln) amidotransferase subunit GatB [Candidatus Limnocylindria bacterium]|nr:Asp-tRNA(Asn)/Glu-tRNA(Gln) amidotransferase subunit GatB [Candidatus Limnocylindria bacterium]
MTVSAPPYETIIGIECHVELDTRSKMFCGCSAKWFGAPPNTLTCEVCLGLPGALPVPNRKAIELSIAAGIALHCETPAHTKFDRKNYMYPDLPKGYQISQYDLPLSSNGWLEIPGDDGRAKRVGIIRAHLEEDTGSLLHAAGATLIDFNRSGVPLLEIVSAPDLRSVRESLAYLELLRERLVYAGVAEFKLEEGGARFDVNVSIRFTEDGETRWPPLSEIKNLNSFRALEGAVAYESDRLWNEWQDGGELRTRKGKITVGWSPDSRRTYVQRTKEDVDDYRYFPEPDLVALRPDREMVERIRTALPEMPSDRRARFVTQYGLSDYDARVLVSDRALAAFFEDAVRAAPGEAKRVANWVTVELLGHLRAAGKALAEVEISAAQLGTLVSLIAAGTISTTAAKTVFAAMLASGRDPLEIVAEKGLAQVSDEGAIAAAVDAIIAQEPEAAAAVRAGNQRALGPLVGRVMQQTGGKANPALVSRLLVERLR